MNPRGDETDVMTINDLRKPILDRMAKLKSMHNFARSITDEHIDKAVLGLLIIFSLLLLASGDVAAVTAGFLVSIGIFRVLLAISDYSSEREYQKELKGLERQLGELDQ